MYLRCPTKKYVRDDTHISNVNTNHTYLFVGDLPLIVDVWSLLQWSLNACFFLPSRSSILNILYLCNYGSPGSSISSCVIPLSPISNPMGLINIGLFKKGLCPVSHDDLIIDWFSRANLYDVTRVTVSTIGYGTDTQQTTVYFICVNFYEIWIRCFERDLWWFSQGHLFGM